MTLRKLIGLFAGASVLLLLATPPTARAYVQVGRNLTLEKLDKPSAAKAPTTMLKWDDSRILPPGDPRGVRGPTREPMGADVSNPIPEPGTLTLASLGLLALGAAMKKRRGANAPRPAGRG